MPPKAPAKASASAAKQPVKLPVKSAKAASPARTAKVIKIGKRLEAVAREIKDSDEFVEHVAGLAKRYRREHALVAGDSQAELRQSLRTFQKHATALAEWLQQANEGKASAVERQAFDAVGTTLYGSPVMARPHGAQTIEWLTRAASAAEGTLAQMKQGSGDNAALRIAAEGLRATFEHHKLKIALSGGDQQAGAVRLLCVIAREAGEMIEPDAAKVALRNSNRRTASAA